MTLEVYILKGCPKCNGDLAKEKDYNQCMQCGTNYYNREIEPLIITEDNLDTNTPPREERQQLHYKPRKSTTTLSIKDITIEDRCMQILDALNRSTMPIASNYFRYFSDVSTYKAEVLLSIMEKGGYVNIGSIDLNLGDSNRKGKLSGVGITPEGTAVLEDYKSLKSEETKFNSYTLFDDDWELTELGLLARDKSGGYEQLSEFMGKIYDITHKPEVLKILTKKRPKLERLIEALG